MQKINLRDLDAYKTDVFVDVAEEVLTAIRDQQQDDAAYERRKFRHKAYYSLNREDGIENDALNQPPTLRAVLKITRHSPRKSIEEANMEKRAMAVREEQWIQTIAAAKQSGQPIKVWCAEHGVPLSSFYKWQRKMRDSLLAEEKAEIQFQELEVPQNICGPATSDRIHLHIQDILVELPAGASAEQISAVIRGIRHAG